MKRLLRNLGAILMGFNGIAVVAVLLNAPAMLNGMKGTRSANAIVLLCMLAVYGALGYLGYRLYRRGKAGMEQAAASAVRKPAPVPTKPAEPTPAKPAEPTPEPAQPEPTKPAPEPTAAAAQPRLREPVAVLHYDRYADRNIDPTLSYLIAYLEKGMPKVRADWGWNEGLHGGGGGKTEAVPEAMWDSLTPASLRDWFFEAFHISEGKPCDGSLFDNPKLEAWCRLVRQTREMGLPRQLLVLSNPFEYALKDVGPDGLTDASGVRLWLAPADEVEIEPALRALIAWAKEAQVEGEALFLLTENARLLERVPEDVLADCRDSHIHIALCEADCLRDLADGTVYSLKYRQWAGSADDAATYGEWWLDAKRPEPAPVAEAEETLADIAYVRAVRHVMCGPWHQYDVLLDARPYGWAMMLDWAAYMDGADLYSIGTVSVSDIGSGERELVEAYRAHGCQIGQTPELQAERGMLGIGGTSRALKDFVKIFWINQTNTLRVFTMGDEGERIEPYVETMTRRTFGTPDAMKRGRKREAKK